MAQQELRWYVSQKPQNLSSSNHFSIATIQHLSLTNTDTALAGLRDRYLNLVKMGDKLPADNTIQTPEGFDLGALIKILPGGWLQETDQAPEVNPEKEANDGDQEAAPQPSIEDLQQSTETPKQSAEAAYPINRAALAMSLFGWNSVADGAAGLVECRACFRRLGLWMYKPRENGDVTVYTSLDVTTEHMEYCPWIDRRAQSGTGRPNEKTDDLRCGWEVVAEAVKVKHRRRIRSRASMDMIHTNASTPSVESVEGGGDEEKKKADREWWAKIRRMRQVLTTKSPRRKSTVPM